MDGRRRVIRKNNTVSKWKPLDAGLLQYFLGCVAKMGECMGAWAVHRGPSSERPKNTLILVVYRLRFNSTSKKPRG